jgi:hypothetical protein
MHGIIKDVPDPHSRALMAKTFSLTRANSELARRGFSANPGAGGGLDGPLHVAQDPDGFLIVDRNNG